LKILDFTRTSGTQAWDCAAAALSRARVVVAIRYHTAVLRMLAGRSSYNLFYSNKGADLVTRLGQPGCDLATFDVDRELDAVERSAETIFDIAPVRAQVRSDLRRACRKAIAANRPIEDMGAARVI
ncbi:MAG: hypothetical protein OEZ08_15830, partial [Betaproteobacteria bacterium]|nr:hypothetical protein [Betaproteobacteria bacterium]